MFGIQLPQINLPNPIAAVQNAAAGVGQQASNAVNGAGSFINSDVTQLANIGRNVESSYVSPVLASGTAGVNRVITAGNNVAALPGQAVQGVESQIFSAGQTASAGLNSALAIPGNAITGAENQATQVGNEINSAFQQDMASVDSTIQKATAGIAGIITPVAGAGADITKYVIIGVLGLGLIVVFLLIYAMKPGGHKKHRSG